VHIRSYTLIAFINLRALTNFIFIKIVSYLKLKTELKQKPYKLFIINKENINKENRLIYIETKEFHLIYNKTQHFKTI
jgi:hypothetical protein